MEADYPEARIAGYSSVYDYTGTKIAMADDSNEQIVRAKIDIEAARQFREQYFKNQLTLIRTELFAPYYSKPIYPPNTFIHDGPIEELLDEQQLGYFNRAKENLKKCQDFYQETDI